MSQTYYDILGVAADADLGDIGDAFLEAAVQVHPDIVNLDMMQEAQLTRFKHVCLSYACLSDPISKKQYDELDLKVRQQVAARLSLFRIGSENDISENEACSVWEIFNIGRGKVANRILREYSDKAATDRAKQRKSGATASGKKTKSRLDMDDENEGDDDDELVDVTHTPVKLNPRTQEPQETGEGGGVTAADTGRSVKPDLTVEDLVRACKFSMRVEITRILFHYPDMANELDSSGYTAVHWAAKAGDMAVLQTLHINGARLNTPSQSEHSMAPIHWAASDGKVETIKYLLDNQVSINTQDGNGCTPVVIAAQHDRHDCCIFLTRNGADMTLVDNNGDTALHWSAYKGFSQLAGLLYHLHPGSIDVEDLYGQTPLHLAALRGNVECLEYLVIDCHADTTKKDKNSLTAMELACKKKQLKCEFALRQLTSSSKLEMVQQLEVKRLLDTNVLSSIFVAANDREMAAWPWRIVLGSNFIGTCYTMMFAFSQEMTDLWVLHMLNTAVQCCWWFCFWMCLDKKSLAICIDEPSAEDPTVSMYDAAISLIAEHPDQAKSLNLCHTCHVVRPLRSKHCKIQRCCINKFDHFCPFVLNTVSRDNYKYFMGVVCLHAILSLSWFVTAMFYCQRADASFKLYIYIVYLAFWCLAIGSLVQYHISIIVKNMTTNEHINMGKYKHFMDESNRFDNPFDLGNPRSNLLDGLFPSAVQLYTRQAAKDAQWQLMLPEGARRNQGSDREALLSSQV